MQTNRSWPGRLVYLLCLLAVPAGLMAQATAEPAAAEPASATAAAGGLLDVIPADATAFLAIRNLKELDNDIVTVSTKLGFPLGPEGMFPAPLEWLKSSVQLTEGLNERAGAAAVLLNASKAKSVEELENHLVLFVPATDPKALLTSLGGEEGTDGVYRVSLAGSPSVAVIKEKYVLLAKAPEGDAKGAPEALVAAGKAKGDGVSKTMSADRVRAFAKQDLCLWLNLRNVSEDLRKEILSSLNEVFRNASGGAAESQPGEADSLGVGAQLSKFFDEGEEIGIGLSLDGKVGLSMSFYTRVKPGTETAQMIEAMQPSKTPLLAGLPDEAFIISGATTVAMTPGSLNQARKAAEQFAKQLATMDKDEGSPLNPEGLKPLIETWIGLVKDSQRIAVSVSNLAGKAEAAAEKPATEEKAADEKATDAKATDAKAATDSAPGTSGGVIGLAVVVQTKDAKAWRDQLHKAFDQVKEIAAGVVKADKMEQAKIDQMLGAFVWKAGAGEVAGAQVDQLSVDLAKLPDADATSEELGKLKSVLGEDGIMFRIATVGDDLVVITLGGGDKRLEEVITLAKAGDAPLGKNKQLAKVAGRLPKGQYVAEGFVSFDNLLGAVDAIATRLDSPLPVKLSLKNAAPLAFVTQNVDKSAQEVTVLVPMELITSMADMIRQQLLPMFMMGGTGGGQGQDGMGQPGAEEDEDQKPGDDEGAPKAKPKAKARKAQPKTDE